MGHADKRLVGPSLITKADSDLAKRVNNYYNVLMHRPKFLKMPIMQHKLPKTGLNRVRTA
jgi:hypothetical protein